MSRLAAVTAAALLFAAACSGGDASPRGDLVVADDAGVVVLAETGEVVRRVGDTASGSLAFQPTWSPDGTSIAFSELSGDEAAIVIADLEGETTRMARSTFPYYVSWDPDGSGFVTLRNADAGGGILVESVTTDGTTEEIDAGAPYYFDWDPEGGRYLAHVALDRLAVLEPGSEPIDLDVAAGSFQAPSWGADGQVYLRQGPGGQTLSVDSGDGPRDVATVVGAGQLVVSSGRAAIQSFALTDGSGQQAALQSLPRIDPGALHVVDLDDSTVTEVVDHSVFAFFWSPDGGRLLVLDIPEAGTVRWLVWDGETTAEYPSFQPNPAWVASFLPFFDQYATSMSLWNGDGSVFAYAGIHGGDSGIWLQHLDETDPVKLSDGTWVSWRPG